MLLGDVLSGNARRDPHGRAWRFKEAVWTWAEADGRVNRLAHSLIERGLQFGDRVVIVANNSNQYLELVFALAKNGMVAVPLPPRAVWREIAYALEEVDARALFVAGELLSRLKDVPDDLDRRVALVGMDDERSCALGFEELVRNSASKEPDLHFSDDAVRVIKFTSGTTGNPKGCIGTHRTMMASVLSDIAFSPPVSRTDVCLMAVSLATGFGLNTFTAFALKGAETIIVEKFDAPLVLDLIQRNGVARACGVPTMIASLTVENDASPRDLSSLKYFFYTGSPVSVAAMRRATEVLGCEFYQGYGSTETGGRVTYLPPEEHRRAACGTGQVRDAWGRNIISCGREMPGCEVRLVNADLEPVGDGEVGELMVRSDTLFGGYWRKPRETEEALRNGWLLTGDLGTRDSEGYFYIVDRKRDMIVSGGYNVYSVEVETVIRSLSGVAEVAVFGVFDAKWGETVCAVAIPGAGAELQVAEIDRHCRRNLSDYKCPKKIVIAESLPKTSTGKIRKVELRSIYGSPDPRGPEGATGLARPSIRINE